MDYSIDPAISPNSHDYEQLGTIYSSHKDSGSTLATATAQSRREAGLQRVPQDEGGNSPAEWGTAIRRDRQGRPFLYERDLGGGVRLLTRVIWAQDARPGVHFGH